MAASSHTSPRGGLVSQLIRTFVLVSLAASSSCLLATARAGGSPTGVAARQETGSGVAGCLTAGNVPFLTAASTDYAAYASPYNLHLQYRPVVVVLAETNEHVAESVVCAAEYNLKVQAKSGGHSYASYSSGGKDGAVIIDLKKFQAVSVDTNTSIATFGAGLRLGNLALALQPYGRALPHGTCTGVGVGGHFTVGGDGFMARKYGLAIDSVVAMDVVLANGSVVHATATAFPDVFFAMRGAGHSFGIATTFYGQTVPQPKVLTGYYFTWPGLGANATGLVAALAHLQAYAWNATAGLDRNLQFDVTVDAWGSFILKGMYLGPAATFNQTVLPELLRGLPDPGAADDYSPTLVAEHSWEAALQDANYGGPIAYPKPGDAGFVPTPDHDRFYTKSLITPVVPAAGIRNLAAWAAEHQGSAAPTPWYFTLSLQGGHDNQVFVEDKAAGAAFSRRNATWVWQNTAGVDDVTQPLPVPAGIDLVKDLTALVTDALGKGNYGAYQAYVDPELSAEEAGQLYYGDALFTKLKGLKKKLDPGNVFSNPQSIPVGE